MVRVMNPAEPAPSEENDFLADRTARLLASYRHFTGRDLLGEDRDGSLQDARSLYRAPIFVASHGGGEDPVFNYGNLTAQRLFELDWAAFTSMRSRFTAEAPNRAERARLLERVRVDGFIDDYAGVRISATGRRFRIEGATVWTVLDEEGRAIGQAATFAKWTPL